MTLNDINVPKNDEPKAFAEFFDNKITQIINETQIVNDVYNGKTKVDHPKSFFMADTDILECL